MIVVKKSLEKKCEKVVSGRRSKTPRESTKETKLTKMRKRSSKRMSRSSKSKTSDNEEEEENTTDRDESPEKNVQVGESAARRSWRTSLDRPAEEDEAEAEAEAEAEGEGEDKNNKMESRMMEFGEFVDGTDSTSQETVERVVVTAMVHKDQVPDTPKSAVTSLRSSPSRKEEDIDLSFSENKTISARLEVEKEEEYDKREGKNVRTCCR